MGSDTVNKESGLYIATDKLGQFAKDVVDAKVLMGQCTGRSGWDDDNEKTRLATKENLDRLLQNAVWNKEYAKVLCYSAMLQARIYMGIDEV